MASFDGDGAVPVSPFAVVIVRNAEGRYLAVEETRGRGWWLPAGHVDAGQTFEEAAHRETLEEGGVRINLEGVFRVEHSPCGPYSRVRIVYLAKPYGDPTPKSVEDEHSVSSAWMTLPEIAALKKKKPGLRGRELLQWGEFLEKGGRPMPMSLVTGTNAPFPPPAPIDPMDVPDATEEKGDWVRHRGCPTHFAVRVVVKDGTGSILVHRSSRSKLSLPTGRLDAGQTFLEAGVALCHAIGVPTRLTNVLRVEHGLVGRQGAIMTAIMSGAITRRGDALPTEYAWMTPADATAHTDADDVLRQWAAYVHAGGAEYPLHAITVEGEGEGS